MDQEENLEKTPSAKVLKQMSITRQDLERSSENLVNNLSKLKKSNEEQLQSIDETLMDLKKEQTTAEKLLGSDWMNQSDDLDSKSCEGTLKKPLRREPTIVRQLRQWTTADVIRWLEKEGLHKFILTFQRHHVKGEDLAEIRLPFLDNYDHISVSDKELLLSHVYELLRLESEEQDALDHITSSVDREKYMAARQISKDHEHYKGSNSPIIFLPSHNSTRSSSPSSVSSPIPKLRKCSESSVMTNSTIRERRAKALKKMPHKKKPIVSLFDLFEGHQKQEVNCVHVNKQDGDFGLDLDIDYTGSLVVVKTDDYLASLLGSRVLEINGYLSSQIDIRQLQNILLECHELYLVLSQNNRNITEDKQWDTLRSVLTNLRDNDEDISVDGMDDLNDKYALQEDLDKSREEIDDLNHQVKELSEQLALQTKVMGEMKEQRDNALRNKVKARFGRSASDVGETEYYKMTMESLDVESATKEKVMDSLKEIVKEASRQKFYLDRLISVVIEESPWLLDQVDADFDDSSLVSQHEEFC